MIFRLFHNTFYLPSGEKAVSNGALIEALEQPASTWTRAALAL